MKRLDDEKNHAFFRDPRRVAAQKELDGIVSHIGKDIKAVGSAQYLLTVLPPLLKRLETAYEDLNIIEAQILCEIEGDAE